MTALLPDAVREAVTSYGTYPATESFGLVVFVLAVLLLIEREALTIVRRGTLWSRAVTAVTVPLVIVVMTMIFIRIDIITG